MKTSIAELAILGGAPTFSEPLHVGQPNLGRRERFLARMEDILDRRWLTNQGPYVAELESRLCALLGVRHCIAMCNATVALEIAIRALGLRDEVIVPSFTFVATAHALQWQEITPVFADIDPVTHGIDPECVERLITPRTTGIIGVHLWGRPCDVDALQDLAARRNLRLLFDAAHALGSAHAGRPIGSFGQAEIFSFHATKFINSFEGGAVATNDDSLAQRIRLMKNFGFSGYDNVVYVGTNGKMPEVSAAMALTNLESLDEFTAAGARNQHIYGDRLAGLPGVRWVTGDAPGERSNRQYVVLEVDEAGAGLSRNDLLRVLFAENVLARRYFYPGCHRMEPYLSTLPEAFRLLPHTEAVCDRVLVLPTGATVSPAQAETVAGMIRLAVEHSAELRLRLPPGEVPRKSPSLR